MSDTVTLYWMPPDPADCLSTYLINIELTHTSDELFQVVTEGDKSSYSLKTTVLHPGLTYMFTVTGIDNGNKKGAESVPIACAVPSKTAHTMSILHSGLPYITSIYYNLGNRIMQLSMYTVNV